jgi:succinyl-diaminopimelate desuccinylase
MARPENLFEWIDGYRNEVIDIQRGLTSKVALGPENGGSGEHEKTAFIKELILPLKPDFIEEIKAPDKRAKDGYRPNLIARWDGSSVDSVIWVLSHSDIVPPGDLTLWETDPYEIVVHGDKIVGRGVEDNQHGFVSSYLGLKAMIETGRRSKKSVGLAVVADEETGSNYGLGYLLKHQKKLFKEEDFIIVPDFGNSDGTLIEVAEKSMLWLRFIVTGQQCHASTPHRGRNSLFGAAKLIVALEGLKRKYKISDELFSPPVSTFEPTKMEANVPNVNTIPGRDIFYMDCRILPRYRVDEIVTASREIAVKIGNELGLRIEVEATYRQDATKPTEPDAPVVKALSQAIKEVTGKDAKPMGIGGGTVAAFFREAGLPAAVWCTMPDTAHQPNEYCLISNIITDAKVFATLYQQ